MELGHGQRAYQHNAVNRVCQVAQPAADARQNMITHQNPPIPVALALGRLAHPMPEGKRLARADENAVELFIGKADVDGLVLLQDWVDALAALDEVRTVLRHYAGQRRGILRVGIVFLCEKILDMALADFLLQRNFVTGRADIAEHETASLSYAVQTAPAARVTVVKPEDGFFQHTLFAIVRLAGQPDEIH